MKYTENQYLSNFVRLRRGLEEHVEEGRMTSDMLSVYTYLLLKADFNNGIVWHTSAPYLALIFRKSASHLNRQLLNLEKRGYLKRFNHRGKIAAYEILINKYLVFNGVLIDSDNSNSINEIAFTCVVKGELIGTFERVKMELNEFYVTSYKEIKEIRIKKEKEKKSRGNISRLGDVVQYCVTPLLF